MHFRNTRSAEKALPWCNAPPGIAWHCQRIVLLTNKPACLLLPCYGCHGASETPDCTVPLSSCLLRQSAAAAHTGIACFRTAARWNTTVVHACGPGPIKRSEASSHPTDV